MRTSRTGTFSKEAGFTLIELVVVMAIIGLAAVVTVPRWISMLPRGVEAEARRVAHMAEQVAAESALRQTEGQLVIDMDEGRYGMEIAAEKGAVGGTRRFYGIGEGVRIESAETASSGLMRHGRLAIRFFPWGGRDAAVVQLSDGKGGVRSVVLDPMRANAEVQNGEARLLF